MLHANQSTSKNNESSPDQSQQPLLPPERDEKRADATDTAIFGGKGKQNFVKKGNDIVQVKPPLGGEV